jgi:SpoVK/Ycf46/Vps4 family AAA+-type ATPase
MNPDMQEVCKKRRVLLYGPPGTGKTSLIASTFNFLSQSNITCISLNDVDSMRMSIEEIFSFIMKFLAPAFIVFEDIDLLGFDRNTGMNPLIGRLLALFDGIEEADKAVVFCSTTNRFDVLDKAFTRPCRVDRKFQIDCLTDVELDQLFQLLLKVDATAILKGKKLTGSHVQEISDTAKLLAKKNSGDPIAHVDEATKIVLEHFYLSSASGKVGFETREENEKIAVEEREAQRFTADSLTAAGNRSPWENKHRGEL